MKTVRWIFAFVNAAISIAVPILLISRDAHDNHVGFEPLMLLAFPVVQLILEVPMKRKGLWIRITCAGVLGVVVFYMDQWNYMVQYDRWLKRGMPLAGEFRISSELRDALRSQEEMGRR